jgi:hypothetical protein
MGGILAGFGFSGLLGINLLLNVKYWYPGFVHAKKAEVIMDILIPPPCNLHYLELFALKIESMVLKSHAL